MNHELHDATISLPLLERHTREALRPLLIARDAYARTRIVIIDPSRDPLLVWDGNLELFHFPLLFVKSES
jgi:hypothetical protein